MTRTRTGEGQTALVTGASMGIGVDLAAGERRAVSRLIWYAVLFVGDDHFPGPRMHRVLACV